MIRGLSLATVVACLLATGCATPYQRAGLTGGYDETRVAPDLFKVSFDGNGFVSRDQVRDYAMLRAAELTLEGGSRYFAVVSTEDRSRTETAPADYPGMFSTYGPSGRPSTTLTYNPPQTGTHDRPGVGMTIRTFKDKPEEQPSYDAEALARSIRARYKLN